MADLPKTDAGDDITAAELALGVLEGEERAAATRRVLAEPAFAREVERWRDQFGLLFAQWPEVSPPAHLGARLDRAIAPPSPSRLWPALALSAMAIAAVLAGILLLQPAQIASPPVQPSVPALVANLAPAQPRGTPVPAIYDPARQEILVASSALAPAGRSAELWLIPADGVARSLGVLAEGKRTTIKLRPEHSRLIGPETTLAVTDEPSGGSPTGKATGPIVASGSLIPV